MPWQACDSGDEVKTILKTFIQKWLKNSKYKPRIPRQHWHVVKVGEKQNAGINIVLVTRPDPESNWTYRVKEGDDAGKKALEENHEIAIVVKGDDKSGGENAVSKVFNTVKFLMNCEDGSEERNELISLGITNLFETTEGIDIDPGREDEEGVEFRNQLNLKCSTDTLIN